ncbi:hypothetical protein QN219_04895 [Sinorhizobium sp. 7-81]|uniref:hypothetical protein n=1 Tax=Sinorhizobium sp. 8-89 TaxID=3049089 RepID=UPI0024C2559B|nr:hypothetical protein [Sinorhizobium sp. 8-89]MDK1489394.1 hypothetical protein [Sinorhizobium sp. 8-89]
MRLMMTAIVAAIFPQYAGSIAVTSQMIDFFRSQDSSKSRDWWNDTFERSGVCPGCSLEQKFGVVRDRVRKANELIKLGVNETILESTLPELAEAIGARVGFFYFRNKCGYPFSLAVRVQKLGGEWATISWYHVEPGSNAQLFDPAGSPLASTNRIIYVYGTAPTPGGGWRGRDDNPEDRTYDLDGKRVRFLRIEAPRTPDNDFLVAPCG